MQLRLRFSWRSQGALRIHNLRRTLATGLQRLGVRNETTPVSDFPEVGLFYCICTQAREFYLFRSPAIPRIPIRRVRIQVLKWLLAFLVLATMAEVSTAYARVRNSPLVLAAASLQESLTAAADSWAARKHPKPVISFAASSALARQIESGAPADIFISADEEWMDSVQKHGLVRAGTRTAFLGNRLVLIAPAGSRGGLAIRRDFPLAAALGDGRLAVADPDSVPAGKYAKAALTSLGVWAGIEPKLARGENVRSALAFVERGEAPYGIVYETDAMASKKVRIVGRFPANSHPPISYPVAVLTNAKSPDAEGFRRFLISSAGKAIFRRYGFTAR